MLNKNSFDKMLAFLEKPEVMPQIDVNESNAGIRVILKNIDFSVDCIGNRSIMFWLDDDEADRLAFHLNSCLQDKERFNADNQQPKQQP